MLVRAKPKLFILSPHFYVFFLSELNLWEGIAVVILVYVSSLLALPKPKTLLFRPTVFIFGGVCLSSYPSWFKLPSERFLVGMRLQLIGSKF